MKCQTEIGTVWFFACINKGLGGEEGGIVWLYI